MSDSGSWKRSWPRKTKGETYMRAAFAVIIASVFAAGSALAQGVAPSGRGAVTGDPAASSATPHTDSPTTGAATRSNPSGSGTSTSGG
jgi:hypothetical protein